MKYGKFLFSFFTVVLTTPLLAEVPNKFVSTTVEDKNPLSVLTPSLKEIQTKKLILHNGIKVFVISDPKARKSAASLAVNAGSWHDDPKYPGVAHFCEHMVFMGSKKYPDQNHFCKFINDNGGIRNAYTARDRTVYMYTINNDHIYESLDIFSRFFIDPLFNESAVSRELLAVNQEFQKSTEHDGWRCWYIFKQEGNQNHPNINFSCGNNETIGKIGTKNLKKWYKKHYKPSGMHLVVYSSKDLDSLVDGIEKSFNQVPATVETIPSIPYAKIASPNQEGHITFVEPVKDIRSMDILWEIPPAYANDMNKKTYYLIAHSLTHKLKGGLYTQLKEEGLINDLTSSCNRYGSNHLIMNIEFDLTAEGLQKKDHILYTFYSVLNKVKKGNIPLHIYQDTQSVLSTTYRWQSRKDAFDMVQNLAANMVDEDLDTFPYKTEMITEFDPKSSRDLLNFLTPYNAMIVILGQEKETHRKANKEEKWFKAKYSVSKIPSDVLASWENASPHEDFTLPNPNPYVSKHQKLLVEEATAAIENPSLIANDEGGICYYLQDTHYLVPKTQVKIRLKSPEINASTASLCKNQLFAAMLNRKLASLTAEGAFAGISTKIYADQLGLNISVDGYHDKIGSYMMSFLSTMVSKSPSKEEFLQVKEQLSISYKDENKELPFRQGMRLITSLLSNVHMSSSQKSAAIESITFEEYETFHSNVLQNNHLKVYISGNIDKESALVHYSGIKTTLGSKEGNSAGELIPEFTPFYSGKPFPKMVKVKTSMHGNTAILALDGGSFSYKNNAPLAVLSPIIGEAFYTELRSNQQTGYITASVPRNIEGELMRYFIVQSTTHYPEELLARYELFLENFSKNLASEISEERFEAVKKSEITNLEKPCENLSQHAAINFELAFTYGGDFDRNKKKVEALKNLDYQTFISTCQQMLSRKNKKRLAILIEGAKVQEEAFSYTEITTNDLLSLRKE
ncbi:insulinase family protein [bacterium]|nr:insulinase family protein [bacterium]